MSRNRYTVGLPTDAEELSLTQRKAELNSAIRTQTKALLRVRSEYEKDKEILALEISEECEELLELQTEAAVIKKNCDKRQKELDVVAEELDEVRHDLENERQCLLIQAHDQTQRENALRSNEQKVKELFSKLDIDVVVAEEKLVEARKLVQSTEGRLLAVKQVESKNDRDSHRIHIDRENAAKEKAEAKELSQNVQSDALSLKTLKDRELGEIKTNRDNLARWETELSRQKKYLDSKAEELAVEKAKSVNEREQIKQEYKSIGKVKLHLKAQEAKLKEKSKTLEYMRLGIIDGRE